MGLSTALKNAILDEVFGAVDYTAETDIYIGLSSTTPTVTGTNVTEPSGGSYARVQKTNNATNWPSASGGAKSNGTAITFPTATGDWVSGADLTHVVLYNAASSGTFLGYGALTTPKPVLNGDTASYAIGELDITLVDA